MTTFTLPFAIDKTGTTDVAIPVNKWLQSIKPVAGDTVKFEGTLLITNTIVIGNPKNILDGINFDLTDCFISMPQTIASHYGNPMLSVRAVKRSNFIGGRFKGANPLGLDAVKAGKEGWSGITYGADCEDLHFYGQTVEEVWGDFIFGGGGDNKNITFTKFYGRRTGRHAISFRQATNLKVEYSTFEDVQRLFIDHEPAKGQGIDGLEISNCVSPSGGLGLFLQLVPTRSTFCKNIYIHDHVLTNGHYRMSFGVGGVQRENIKLVNLLNNTSKVAGNLPLISIGSNYFGWDNVEITNLHNLVNDVGRSIKVFPTCHNVSIDYSGIKEK